MKVKFHKAGFERAKVLIKAHEYESFDNDWQEEKPTPDEVVKFLDAHDIEEYGLFFLGVNEEIPDEAKEHYIYPHGDLKEVQLSALVQTQKEAEKNGHKEIAQAAKTLLEMIEKSR
jgi:hypothetical protein